MIFLEDGDIVNNNDGGDGEKKSSSFGPPTPVNNAMSDFSFGDGDGRWRWWVGPG